jgi:hypothetical protein
MKQLLTSSLKSLVLIFALFVNSCSKKDGPQPIVTPPIDPPPTPKVATLIVTHTPSNAVDFNSTVTETWTTQNVASLKRDGKDVDASGTMILNSLKKDTIIYFTASVASGITGAPSITGSDTIKVKADPRIDLLRNHGSWKQTEDKIRPINSTGAWTYFSVPCYKITFTSTPWSNSTYQFTANYKSGSCDAPGDRNTSYGILPTNDSYFSFHGVIFDSFSVTESQLQVHELTQDLGNGVWYDHIETYTH